MGRITGTRILLTYKTHLDKQKYREWLTKERECDWVVIAHETGEEGQYEHTHVFVKTTKKVDLVGAGTKVFDYTGIHPNIKLASDGSKDTERIIKYLSKEDKLVENEARKLGIVRTVEDQENLAEAVWRCNDLAEAMRKYCRKATDATGIQTLWACKPVEFELNLELREWQEKLVAELDHKPDDRKVIWYVDHNGGQGKTTLAKWLFANRKALVIAGAQKISDVSTIVRNHIAEYGRLGIVVLNLTRTEEEVRSVYKMIEQLKDGLLTASKYNGKTIVFDSPHVVVFANWAPNRENLSEDRWSIRHLS